MNPVRTRKTRSFTFIVKVEADCTEVTTYYGDAPEETRTYFDPDEHSIVFEVDYEKFYDPDEVGEVLQQKVMEYIQE
jgi:hypothetical protein